MRKLKSAPSLNCRDIQTAIDNLCSEMFTGEIAQRTARVYLYRTRLNKTPSQVAAIFDLDAPTVNGIVYHIGRNKPREIKSIEYSVQVMFKRYHMKRYKNHLQQIIKRINNRTLALQS